MQFKFGMLGKNNREILFDYFFKSLLSKCNALFEWQNLPETINENFLNSCLFLSGYIAFFEKGGSLHANIGGLGGKPDENYYNTRFILANPILGNAEFEIGKNCEIMYNTASDQQLLNLTLTQTGGLYTLIHTTATMLTDNALSINSAQINSRVQSVFRADNDGQAQSARAFLERQYSGEPFSIITSDDLQKFDVLNLATDTGDNLTHLIELHQHIIADFYNQIGITTTPYQKKERLITDEINSIDRMTACTLSAMLSAREEACEKINKMFDTNISVKLADFLTDPRETSEETGETEEKPTEEEKEKEGAEENAV